MTYREEFPDFDSSLPTIAGLTDQSWHNDACPVLRNASGTVELWCDYADASAREFPDAPRFMLVLGNGAAIESETLSEDFLAAVASAIERA